MKAPLFRLSAIALFTLSGSVRAQGLPLYHALNPVAESRSGLYFQPYQPRHSGWAIGTSLNYASAAEINFRDFPSDSAFVMDAEFLRLNAVLTRDLDARNFVSAEAFAGGSYAGFMDGFLHWYHGLLGISFPERDDRPRNRFDYEVLLPDGHRIRRAASSLYLGDIRVGIGHRFSDRVQSHLSFTLPTTTAPAGYGRGTLSANLITTLRVPLAERLSYEASLGVGVTPTHGDLSAIQRTLFGSFTSGARLRLFKEFSAFANVYFHSPYYQNTGLPALDGHDLSLDFGFLIRDKHGHDWLLGMTEDPDPSGPAIDLTFRVAKEW
ncbi:MAG: DUF3187 family protein [Gemmatimonadota bacterium]